MISGRDFFVLSDDWNGLPTSTIHLFRHISPHNRVFWLNVINRMPRPTWNDAKKVANTFRQWGRQLVGAKQRSNGHEAPPLEGVYPATAFTVPWFNPAIRRLNCASLLRSFEALSRRYQIQAPIVFTTLPSTVDFLKTVTAAPKIYCCVDEWAHYPGFNGAAFRAMEERLLDHIDGFIATSRDLERKGERCRASLYLPHGVDFKHFNQERAELEPIAKMENIRRPIVGFFGLIAQWVDLKLIATLSKRFPDVSFVLIGRSVVRMDVLADCRNVHYLGLVPYADLPRYANYFDVGLVPFVTNRLTQAVNPLKLMEYFALGLPALATRLPELESVDGPIRLASTPADFCEQLQATLDDSTFEAKEARQLAMRNTWEQRAEELSNFIERLSGNAA